jgi:hypothetical protein
MAFKSAINQRRMEILPISVCLSEEQKQEFSELVIERVEIDPEALQINKIILHSLFQFVGNSPT